MCRSAFSQAVLPLKPAETDLSHHTIEQNVQHSTSNSTNTAEQDPITNTAANAAAENAGTGTNTSTTTAAARTVGTVATAAAAPAAKVMINTPSDADSAELAADEAKTKADDDLLCRQLLQYSLDSERARAAALMQALHSAETALQQAGTIY